MGKERKTMNRNILKKIGFKSAIGKERKKKQFWVKFRKIEFKSAMGKENKNSKTKL